MIQTKPFTRPAPTSASWTVQQWQAWRDHHAAYLETDPAHKPSRAVIALCDSRIASLASSQS